jgi:ELWxxDGT repeat protein
MKETSSLYQPKLSLPLVFAAFLSLMCFSIGQAQQVKEYVRLAADINQSPAGSSPSGLVVYNNALYFAASDGTHGIELWKYDGTNATRITDLSPGSVNSFVSSLAVFNGALYFRGSGTTNGTIDLQLWKYDGTSVTRISNIHPGGAGFNPIGLTVYNSALYFSANDGTNGTELWKYDGSNVSLAADINPGSASSNLRVSASITAACFLPRAI